MAPGDQFLPLQIRNCYPKGKVANDDVLDALIAAIEASRCLRDGVAILPGTPEIDSRGLSMEIVFAL